MRIVIIIVNKNFESIKTCKIKKNKLSSVKSNKSHYHYNNDSQNN